MSTCMFIFAFVYYLLLFKHHDLEASSPTIWLATRGASFFHITFVGIDPLLHHSMTMNPPPNLASRHLPPRLRVTATQTT